MTGKFRWRNCLKGIALGYSLAGAGAMGTLVRFLTRVRKNLAGAYAMGTAFRQ